MGTAQKPNSGRESGGVLDCLLGKQKEKVELSDPVLTAQGSKQSEHDPCSASCDAQCRGGLLLS